MTWRADRGRANRCDVRVNHRHFRINHVLMVNRNGSGWEAVVTARLSVAGGSNGFPDLTEGSTNLDFSSPVGTADDVAVTCFAIGSNLLTADTEVDHKIVDTDGGGVATWVLGAAAAARRCLTNSAQLGSAA